MRVGGGRRCGRGIRKVLAMTRNGNGEKVSSVRVRAEQKGRQAGYEGAI